VATWTRRRVSGGLGYFAAVLVGLGASQPSLAKHKKPKRCNDCCRENATRCTKASGRCKSKFCLKPPFTIEARWSSSLQDHDLFLFVPNAPGNHDPAPFIDYSCLAGDTNDGALYPYAFASGDAQGPGDEVITVKRLVAGRYEVWVRVDGPALAKDLTVQLRAANGKVIGAWESPPNPDAGNGLVGWHLFDIDGDTRSITVFDAAGIDPFEDAHPDHTFVCPP
jgi:hypothetical protein